MIEESEEGPHEEAVDGLNAHNSYDAGSITGAKGAVKFYTTLVQKEGASKFGKQAGYSKVCNGPYGKSNVKGHVAGDVQSFASLRDYASDNEVEAPTVKHFLDKDNYQFRGNANHDTVSQQILSSKHILADQEFRVGGGGQLGIWQGAHGRK